MADLDTDQTDVETKREPEQNAYTPPTVTVLGTIAELTRGVNFGDGGDLHAYQS
jgi:hypothetical protein